MWNCCKLLVFNYPVNELSPSCNFGSLFMYLWSEVPVPMCFYAQNCIFLVYMLNTILHSKQSEIIFIPVSLMFWSLCPINDFMGGTLMCLCAHFYSIQVFIGNKHPHNDISRRGFWSMWPSWHVILWAILQFQSHKYIIFSSCNL